MTSTDPRRGGHDRQGDELHNPLVGHESSDIDVRTVLQFGAGMVVIAVVCMLVIRVLFGVLERQARAEDPQPSAVARPVGQLPPEPRLETNERAALAKFRDAETKTLEGYGWVDQVGGVTRIPVAEAKKLLIQRGLPARAGGGNPLEGTHAPAMGEASGGQKITDTEPGVEAAPAAAPPAAAAAPNSGK
jgi:hypothetical protein